MKSMTNRPRVQLFWPAMWTPEMTYPALPSLSAFLRANGVDSQIEDLNLRYIDYCMSRENIHLCRKLIALKKCALSKGERKAGMLAQLLLNKYGDEGQLRFAKASCASDEDAAEVVNAISQVMNLLYNPSRVNLLKGACETHIASVPVLESFVEEWRDKNPFVAFIERHIGKQCSDGDQIFGISLTGMYQMLFTYTLAKAIKEKYPGNRLVIGGGYLPYMMDALKDRGNRRFLFRYVDAYVVGSGEKSFLEYIRQDGSKNRMVRIPGVIMKEFGRFMYYKTEAEPPASDQMVVPDYRYLRTTPKLFPEMGYAVEVARGCYWGRCTFCSNMRGSNRSYQPLKDEMILACIRRLVEVHNARRIVLSSLATAPALLERISLGILKSGLRVKWSSWCRMEEALSDDKLRLFKKAGCVSLMAAPDNFDDRILDSMRKGGTGSGNKRILLRLVKHGLLDCANIIIGYPGESKRNILEMIEFIRRSKIVASLYPFYVLKASPVAKSPESFGITLLKAERLLSHYEFSFIKKDCLAVAREAVEIAKRRYPSNILSQNDSGGVFVDFRDWGSGGVKSRRRRPLLPSFLRLFDDGGHYWVFNTRTIRACELDRELFRCLRICDGARTIDEIGRELGLDKSVVATLVNNIESFNP